jgi:GxxExxY protein
MAELKYKDITEKIIGAAMRVHAALGNGFQQVIYQKTPEIELKEMGVSFLKEFNMPVFYKNQQIGQRKVDFFVEEKISFELKAMTNLEPVHFVQARNYSEANNLEIGLLISFGSINLRIKRLQSPKFVASPFSLNQ